MYSSNLYRTGYDHFITMQEILQFNNKFLWFTDQDGRNEFGRNGYSL